MNINSNTPQTVLKRHLWISVSLLLLTITWLVAHFPHTSLWYDEALTTFVARNSWATLWAWCTQVDIQVPFHYVLLRLWTGLVGDSEFALRALSLGAVILTIAALIALGRKLHSRGLGYTAALLLAFLPGTLWIAYEVRAYATALALFTWATVFLIWLITPDLEPVAVSYFQIKHRRMRFILIYVLLMLATLYTHYTAIGAFAAHGLILVVNLIRKRSRASFQLLVVVVLLVGIGFAPWLPVILARSASDRSYFVGDPIQPSRSIAIMLGFALTGREDMPEPLNTLVRVVAIVMVFGLIATLVRREQRKWFSALSGVFLILAPVTLTALTVYFKPKLAGRYAWPAWIGVYLLVGLAVVTVWRWRLSKTWWGRSFGKIAGSLMLISLIVLPNVAIERGHPPASDYRAAFAYLCEHGTPNDIVYLHDGTLFVTWEYYGKRSPCDTPRYAIGAPMALITDVNRALRSTELGTLVQAIHDRRPPNVWVISWQSDIMDPQGVLYYALDSILNPIKLGLHFGDVQVDRYTPTKDGNSSTPLTQSVSITPNPDGATLAKLELYAESTLHVGDHVILYTTWQSGKTLYPNLRASAQITSADGGWVYTQVDQPPAGWKFVDDRWNGEGAIGRYALTINDDVPTGEFKLRYILYNAGEKDPLLIMNVATLHVER